MNRWDARDLILRREPERALRANFVDPLPPRPKPCTCADEDKIEMYVLESLEPIALLCGGACGSARRADD